MFLNLCKITNFSYLLQKHVRTISNKFKCECLTQVTKETRTAL